MEDRIYNTYRHLTSEELKEEIELRTKSRYDTRKVGADGCMLDATVIRTCRKILEERNA